MLLDENAVSLFVGVIIGTVGSMLGLAGGFLMVPYLNLLLGLSIRKAVGTSLLASIFTATSATAVYSRQRRVDIKLGLFLASIATPSSLLGAYITQFIASDLLRMIFGVVLAYASVNMIIRKSELKPSAGLRSFLVWNRKFIDRNGKEFDYSADVFQALVGSVAIGLSSGLIGVGGGVVGVPYLTMVMGVPVQVTMATTIFTSIFVSTGGSVVHASLMNVAFPLVAFLGVGVSVGGFIGAKLAPRIKPLTIRRIFGVVLLVIAARMILQL